MATIEVFPDKMLGNVFFCVAALDGRVLVLDLPLWH